ncbi:MAG: hypothetical protein P8L85_02885 [Rubripirellula sp.]|nr:hypothetical protein [Rubripirellula sp.]
MTSIVDGQPFREGLHRIADEAKVNIWLDRRVDPSRVIRVGPVGPTVFGALETLAASHDCVITPIDNVLLVGRAAWVDQTLSNLLAITPSKNPPATTINWDDLTTPQEALQKVTRSTNTPNLPHDLWPAVMLRAVTPEVSITLILAQFDAKPQFGKTQGLPFQITRSPKPTTASRSYFPGGRPTELRNIVAKLDPKHKTKLIGNQLRILTSPTVHRQLVSQLLRAQQPAGPDPDRDTFTVRKMSTSAANAFQQLAASAGKKCVIDPAAENACQQQVTVEGQDITLKTLVSRIAQQAGVQVTWQNDSILITK